MRFNIRPHVLALGTTAVLSIGTIFLAGATPVHADDETWYRNQPHCCTDSPCKENHCNAGGPEACSITTTCDVPPPECNCTV
jgi:uncharacterized membrane protein